MDTTPSSPERHLQNHPDPRPWWAPHRYPQHIYSHLYDVFYRRVVRLVSKLLERTGIPRTDMDENDLVQEIFWRFFRGLDRGDIELNVEDLYESFEDEDETLRLLWHSARNEVQDYYRYKRAEKRDYRREISLQSLGPGGEPMAPDLPPQEIVMETEHFLHIMFKLPESVRRVIRKKLEGYTSREIADELGISLRTVQMHLHRGWEMLLDLSQS